MGGTDVSVTPAARGHRGGADDHVVDRARDHDSGGPCYRRDHDRPDTAVSGLVLAPAASTTTSPAGADVRRAPGSDRVHPSELAGGVC
jgi:hypothetical protein